MNKKFMSVNPLSQPFLRWIEKAFRLLIFTLCFYQVAWAMGDRLAEASRAVAVPTALTKEEAEGFQNFWNKWFPDKVETIKILLNVGKKQEDAESFLEKDKSSLKIHFSNMLNHIMESSTSNLLTDSYPEETTAQITVLQKLASLIFHLYKEEIVGGDHISVGSIDGTLVRIFNVSTTFGFLPFYLATEKEDAQQDCITQCVPYKVVDRRLTYSPGSNDFLFVWDEKNGRLHCERGLVLSLTPPLITSVKEWRVGMRAAGGRKGDYFYLPVQYFWLDGMAIRDTGGESAEVIPLSNDTWKSLLREVPPVPDPLTTDEEYAGTLEYFFPFPETEEEYGDVYDALVDSLVDDYRKAEGNEREQVRLEDLLVKMGEKCLLEDAKQKIAAEIAAEKEENLLKTFTSKQMKQRKMRQADKAKKQAEKAAKAVEAGTSASVVVTEEPLSIEQQIEEKNRQARAERQTRRAVKTAEYERSRLEMVTMTASAETGAGAGSGLSQAPSSLESLPIGHDVMKYAAVVRLLKETLKRHRVDFRIDKGTGSSHHRLVATDESGGTAKATLVKPHGSDPGIYGNHVTQTINSILSQLGKEPDAYYGGK